MICWRFKILFLLLKFGLILSCGIKKPPKPLPPPEYELKRIGSKVYLIPKIKGLKAEGFVPIDGFLVRDDPSRFCFKVSSPKGREVLSCVEEAGAGRPSLEVEVKNDRVEIIAKEVGTYRLYPYRDGKLIPKPLAEVRGRKMEIERGLKPKIVGVTKVMGRVESEPTIVEIPPVEPLRPAPPEDVRYVVRGDKLFLYWWGPDDEVRFLVYRNGKLLTPEPIVSNYYVDELPKRETVYEIVSVNSAGAKSEPARIVYRP